MDVKGFEPSTFGMQNQRSPVDATRPSMPVKGNAPYVFALSRQRSTFELNRHNWQLGDAESNITSF